MSTKDLFLIVDYNLSRVADVAYMARYARQAYRVRSLLIRPDPGPRDYLICDDVIDLDPRRADFVEQAVSALGDKAARVRGAVVFSDNAVHSGAALLERLGLPVDDAALAAGAFSKHVYRQAEARHRPLLEAQRLMAPDCERIDSMAALEAFARRHPRGFVLKPSCEGNNRGVVLVRAGDDLARAFDEVAPYLAEGVICEELITFRREFSYDGIGALAFVTEKVSASGRYPVEIAQVLPANLLDAERHTLRRAGDLCNVLVGQRDGPFHNEIKLSDDGARAAVVEPNRRPGGMKIWSLAQAVYGIDLYARWVDTALACAAPIDLPPPRLQGATVMLGVASDGLFAQDDAEDGKRLFESALVATIAAHGLAPGQLRAGDFDWLVRERRVVHAVPRDNADFLAQVTIFLGTFETDIRGVLLTLREQWQELLSDAQADLRPYAANAKPAASAPL